MIKGSYEELKDTASKYVCAEHGLPVAVAWHKDEDCHALRCGHGEYPEEVTRELSLTQAYKAGEDIPEPIRSNIEKLLERRIMEQNRMTTAITFRGVPATDLGTGELITRDHLEALVNWARRHDLVPELSHVCLMYSKPYVTIDGYLYHANRTNLSCKLNSRPLNEQERKDYQIKDGDHAWICEVIKGLSGSRFTGQGIVTMDEMTATSKKDETKLRSPVVAAHPWQLAQKRAEWQALRRAFPLGEEEQDNNEARD